MDISSTLSNTGSKQTVLEESSITFASLEEAKKRENDAISNERIKKGDTILETYEVTSDAISGGMGSVWRVHHKSWNTDLAMKRPQPKFFAEGSGKRKEQFIAECENWINLGLHPNIVSCYYVREIGGVPSIFSEWMDGGSLKDRIQDGSLYDGTDAEVQERILNIAIQAARGLQYSHNNLLIHQDMKPGNLLLSKGWDAKVADFGLAKAKEQFSDPSETAKTTGYTLAYCPKEQSDGEEPARWMDVYAWALTVFEMYAGKRLWEIGAEAKDHVEEYFSACEYRIPDEMQDALRSCLTDKLNFIEDVIDELLALYVDMTGKEFNQLSEDTVDSADSLNNTALSYLDLGFKDTAYAYWNKALKAEPNHFHTSFNLLIAKWYDGAIDDVSVLRRLNEMHRIFHNADSAEALRLAQQCRGEDVLVKKIPFSAENADCKQILSEKNESFLYHDEKNHTRLVGENPVNGSKHSACAGMKLYDTLTGRCIRTVMHEPDDSQPASFEQRHAGNFGEAVINQKTGIYCYPDRAHKTLFYRQPDMKSPSPLWMLSKIQSYTELCGKKRRLNQLLVEAEILLDKGEEEREKALELVDEAYALAGSAIIERLNTINRKLGEKYCRISGVRSYTFEECRGRNDLDGDLSIAYTEKYESPKPLVQFNNTWRRTTVTVLHADSKRRYGSPASIPKRGDCYVLQFSNEGKRFSFIQRQSKGGDERFLFLAQRYPTKILSGKLKVRGDCCTLAPDGDTVVTIDWENDFERSVHVYSVRKGKEIKTLTIPNNAFNENDSIKDVCFRYDSKAIFILSGSQYVTMIELYHEQEYVFYPDIRLVENWNGTNCGNLVESRSGVACKNKYDYNMWQINYQYKYDPQLEQKAKQAQKKEKRHALLSADNSKRLILALVMTAVCLLSFFAGRGVVRQRQECINIWNTGSIAKAQVEVAPWPDGGSINKISLEYTVKGQSYHDDCWVYYSKELSSPGVAFSDYHNRKGTVEVHYLPSDPQQYSFRLRTSTLETYQKMLSVIMLVSLCAALFFILRMIIDCIRYRTWY